MSAKAENLHQMYKLSKSAIDTIVTSTCRRQITKAFSQLMCIVDGSCLDDLNKKWPSKYGPSFELGRCAVPSRALQRIKHAHIKTKRWESYVKSAYIELFSTLYKDLSDAVSELHDEENEAAASVCPRPKVFPMLW
jgi:hypothetical protein